MFGFLLGAVAGLLVVRYWRDEIAEFAQPLTRVRDGAAAALKSVMEKTENALGRTEDQLSVLQADQDAFRPTSRVVSRP